MSLWRPRKTPVMNHGVIFILSCAVVCMKVNFLLPQPIVLEEVVQLADDIIGTFPVSHASSRKKFTCRCFVANTKTPHILGVRKYIGPGCSGSQGYCAMSKL